jgi:hypothetical protein
MLVTLKLFNRERQSQWGAVAQWPGRLKYNGLATGGLTSRKADTPTISLFNPSVDR